MTTIICKLALCVILNSSAHTVWLDHPNTHGTASAGWRTRLDPGHVSILATPNRQAFNLTASSPVKHFGLNPSYYHSHGGYWLVENQTPLTALWSMHYWFVHDAFFYYI